jgi:hypothetical protein
MPGASARALLLTQMEPFSRAFELDAHRRHARPAASALVAVLVHGGTLAAVSSRIDPAPLMAPLETEDLSLDCEPENAAPPEQPVPAPPAKIPSPSAADKTSIPSEPAPEPAQAGSLLTKEFEENEEDDPYDEAFVTGDADSYAGGLTSRLGRSIAAVHGAYGGTPGGAGSAKPLKASTPDRSRSAWLVTNVVWDCGFPGEADRHDINYAAVQIVVIVKPNGRAESAEIITDPGYGFGPLARSCALEQQFIPALDRDGNPISGTTRPFTIGFRRQ